MTPIEEKVKNILLDYMDSRAARNINACTSELLSLFTKPISDEDIERMAKEAIGHKQSRPVWIDGFKSGLLHGKGEWVSVEDRLPEDRQTVLVWDNKNVYPAIYDKQWGNFYRYNNTTNIVYFWMPLPTPPKTT